MLTYFCMLMGRITPRASMASNQRGATLIEYALIIAVIAVVVLVTSLTVDDELSSLFSTVSSCLSGSGCS